MSRDPFLLSKRYRSVVYAGYETADKGPDDPTPSSNTSSNTRATAGSPTRRRVHEGERGVPGVVQAWEQLYDPPTGAWNGLGGFLSQERFTEDLLEDWQERYADHEQYGSVELEVGRFYYAFVRMTQPQHILETGTYAGYATAMLAAGLKALDNNGSVVTFDLNPMHHLFDHTDLAELITFVAADTTEVDLAQLGHDSFDLLALDSDHTYRVIATELQRFEPLLKPGGYMVLHDSLYFDGVGLAVEQLMKNPRFEVVTLSTPRTHGRPDGRRPGMTIVRKNHADDGRFPIVVDESLNSIEIHRDPSVAVGDQAPAYLDEVVRSADALPDPTSP